MKKFLILILLAGLGTMVYAQGISFGLKGGLNMPNASGSDAGSPEANMGFAAGAYGTISLLPSIALQPEIYYCQKGFKESGTMDILGTIYNYEAKARINYLEIPVLAKISFGAIVKPYIVAGPYFATRLGTDVEITVDGQSVSTDMDDEVKSSDMGITFGFGVQTPVKLSIEGRYSMGLSSFDDTGYDMDIKNTNIQLLIGYSLF